MFTFEKGDYKYIFEYDTPEELQTYINMVKNNIEEIEAIKIKERHRIAHKIIRKEEESPKEKSHYDFYDLEVKFVIYKKNLEKVGERSYSVRRSAKLVS